MPELISSGWLVFIATGGYALSLVQFFKDFLNVRKLELEIAELRSRIRANDQVIERATPGEIERYGRTRRQDAPFKSTPIALVAGLGVALTLVALGYFSGQQLGAARTGSVTSQVKELKDQLEASRKELKEKQDELKRLREEPTQGPLPRTFTHASGRFTRIDGRRTWIEEPEYAPGQYFAFQELSRDHDYLYLVDGSRRKDGQPLLIRLPLAGGMAQWSYAGPHDWHDLYLVSPQ